ncbi:MAG: FUSC family protein, partial [Clostridia bacterium]|nr:FUSC family protein [Clostridia bacterium]
SWLFGGNRLFGTIFGGLIGMALFSIYLQFYPEGGFEPLMLLLLFIGVILLIVVSVVFKWPGAIQPGGVMLCILLFNQPVDSYVTYSLNRIFDTGVGVVFAMLVNFLLPRERIIRMMDKIHMPHRNL